MAKDFWPDISPQIGTSPFTILREQAEALERKTKGTLRGRVDRTVRMNQFYLAFKIVVPNLDDYEYELFEVHQGVEMYPVIVDSGMIDPGIAKASLSHGHSKQVLNSEAEFEEWLGALLGSDGTKRVIENLLAQSGLDLAS